jgi:chromosome segregation ATPase
LTKYGHRNKIINGFNIFDYINIIAKLKNFMTQTFQEIYDSLTVGKKIKPNSSFENTLKNKARKIVEKQEFEELKARIIGMSEKLTQLSIINPAQHRFIKISQNKVQLDEQILKLTKNILDVISSMNIEKSTIEETKLREQEIKKLINLQSIKLKELEFRSNKTSKKLNTENLNLQGEIKKLTNKIKKLSSELKKFQTSAENIKDHVSAYIDLLKKNPGKTPTIDMLAKYSEGKVFELKRSSWADLLKTTNFTQSVAIRLQNEYDKVLPKIEKCEEDLYDLNDRIKFEKTDDAITSMSKKIDNLTEKKNKLNELADSIEKHKDLFSKQVIDAAKKKKKYTPKVEHILDKEAYDDYSEDALDKAIDKAIDDSK